MKLSIRIQLTLWYSFILVLMLCIYILGTTTLAQRQYHRNPEEVLQKIHQEHPEVFQQQFSLSSKVSPEEITQYIDEIRKEDLRKFRTASLSLFFVLFGFSFFGGYIISGRILRPLQKVNEATRTIHANNLRITIDGTNKKDELGELIQNFNAMTDRLYTSFDLQKQFIENASHELKTPLTISQTNLEAIVQDTQMDRVELQEYIERAMTSIDFMNELIEDLLLLSITKEQVPMETMHIAELIQDAITPLKPIASQAQILITFLPPEQNEQDVYYGNRTLLQRAVMNCLENAIKYAKRNITITLTKKEAVYSIAIQDDGIGIPADALQRVWERFYRVDSARSRKDGGTGLGLAITKTIIELHGGTVDIQSEKGKGTIVLLTL